MLNGAHREIKTLARAVAIYWRYGRGAGSIPLASFKAATLAEALELESNGALELAEAWTAIHKPMPSIAYLSGMLAGFQASKKFARMAASTQAEWSRCISQINADIGTMTRRQLESPAATRELTTWRDRYEGKPRKADYLVTVLKACRFGGPFVSLRPCRFQQGPTRVEAMVAEADFQRSSRGSTPPTRSLNCCKGQVSHTDTLAAQLTTEVKDFARSIPCGKPS